MLLVPKENGELGFRSNATVGGKMLNMWSFEHKDYYAAVITHEFMHNLGFRDMYKDVKIIGETKSLTNPAHENDIMGSRNGKVHSYHIQTLVDKYRD
jgi:hypothetical protein